MTEVFSAHWLATLPAQPPRTAPPAFKLARGASPEHAIYRETIEAAIARVPAGDKRSEFIGRLRDPNEKLFHSAVSELFVGVALEALGFEIDWGAEVGTQTPDLRLSRAGADIAADVLRVSDPHDRSSDTLRLQQALDGALPSHAVLFGPRCRVTGQAAVRHFVSHLRGEVAAAHFDPAGARELCQQTLRTEDWAHFSARDMDIDYRIIPFARDRATGAYFGRVGRARPASEGDARLAKALGKKRRAYKFPFVPVVDLAFFLCRADLERVLLGDDITAPSCGAESTTVLHSGEGFFSSDLTRIPAVIGSEIRYQGGDHIPVLLGAIENPHAESDLPERFWGRLGFTGVARSGSAFVAQWRRGQKVSLVKLSPDGAHVDL